MGKVWIALALGLPVAAVSRFSGGPEWMTLGAAVLALAPLAAWIAEATVIAAVAFFFLPR